MTLSEGGWVSDSGLLQGDRHLLRISISDVYLKEVCGHICFIFCVQVGPTVEVSVSSTVGRYLVFYTGFFEGPALSDYLQYFYLIHLPVTGQSEMFVSADLRQSPPET